MKSPKFDIYEIARLARPALENYYASLLRQPQGQTTPKYTWGEVISKLNVYDEDRVRDEMAKLKSPPYIGKGDQIVKAFLWEKGYHQLTSEFWKNELPEFVGVVINLQRGQIDFCIMHHELGSYSIWRTGMLVDA